MLWMALTFLKRLTSRALDGKTCFGGMDLLDGPVIDEGEPGTVKVGNSAISIITRINGT